MLEAVLAIVILGGFFVLRGIAATVVFFYLLPAGDKCPNCDGATIRVESKGWNRTLPWFRTSWCLHCGWHGLLRHGQLTPTDTTTKPKTTLSS
jgi:hypothetical protein